MEYPIQGDYGSEWKEIMFPENVRDIPDWQSIIQLAGCVRKWFGKRSGYDQFFLSARKVSQFSYFSVLRNKVKAY